MSRGATSAHVLAASDKESSPIKGTAQHQRQFIMLNTVTSVSILVLIFFRSFRIRNQIDVLIVSLADFN